MRTARLRQEKKAVPGDQPGSGRASLGARPTPKKGVQLGHWGAENWTSALWMAPALGPRQPWVGWAGHGPAVQACDGSPWSPGLSAQPGLWAAFQAQLNQNPRCLTAAHPERPQPDARSLHTHSRQAPKLKHGPRGRSRTGGSKTGTQQTAETPAFDSHSPHGGLGPEPEQASAVSSSAPRWAGASGAGRGYRPASVSLQRPQKGQETSAAPKVSRQGCSQPPKTSPPKNSSWR